MNEYYGGNDWRDYHLAHYGVKGMKWKNHQYSDEYLEFLQNNGGRVGRYNAYAKGLVRRYEEKRRRTDTHLKGGLLNIGGGKLAAYKGNKKQIISKPRAKSKGVSAAGDYRDSFGVAKRGKKFFTTSRMVKKNEVSLAPAAKASSLIGSTSTHKRVSNLFTRLGASPGSLLKAIAAGKPQVTSAKKGRRKR